MHKRQIKPKKTTSTPNLKTSNHVYRQRKIPLNVLQFYYCPVLGMTWSQITIFI